ncbi:MAG: hypothetical protein C0412_20070 [Flavobacterium sp.]|nr:hypothetical protein [Flavobacterium sp.]
MKRAFLYIDILGFETLATTNSHKIKNIFKILDQLGSHNHNHHFSLQTVVFSDTVLIFNNSDTEQKDVHLYVTYLIEYAQELFYELAAINVYFRGILTFGEFNFSQLKNIQAYYGIALIDAYKKEKQLEGFGLFVDKSISHKVVVFNKTKISEDFDFVILCQSLKNLYSMTNGVLPTDIKVLTDTDDCYRIHEDLRFLREVNYLMKNHPVEKVQEKYRKVYDIYKKEFPLFFKKFESEGFYPFTINSDYMGHINPFELMSQNELFMDDQESISTIEEQPDLGKYDDELAEALNATLSRFSK